MNFYIILATIIILVVMSIVDMRTKKLNNSWILLIFFFGVIYRLVNWSYEFILAMVFFVLLGYIFYYFNTLGAGDGKLLWALAPLLPYNGIPNMLVVCIAFTLLFGILGGIYGFMLKRTKTEKEIPFVPIILMAYCLLLIININ